MATEYASDKIRNVVLLGHSHDGKTTLTSTALFDSVEDRDGMLQSGMEEGAVETWDRLAEYLEDLKKKA